MAGEVLIESYDVGTVCRIYNSPGLHTWELLRSIASDLEASGDTLLALSVMDHDDHRIQAYIEVGQS
jgi:hypothetical protein